jgi:hypothetical protein
MKATLFLITIVSAVAVWFSFSAKERPVQPMPIAGKAMSDSNKPAKSESVTRNSGPPPASSMVSPPLRAPSAVDPAEAMSALGRALGHSEGSRRISQLFEFAGNAQSGEAAAKAHKDYYIQLKKDPRTVADLKEALESLRIHRGFEFEKANILMFLAEISPDAREVRDLAEREMMNHVSETVPLPEEAQTDEELNRALSTDFSMALPTMAHQVFLKKTESDQERFDGTVSAIRRQANHNIRTAMFQAYIETNPKRTVELSSRLKQLGVEMPNSTTPPGL